MFPPKIQRELVHGLVQIWRFFYFLFLGNIGLEYVFYDILERKHAFLGYKNKKLKKSKNWEFSRGVSPWFLFKLGYIFLCFIFLANISQENVFYDILARKNTSLDHKNRNLKESKIKIFSKGLVHGFVPKLVIFPSFSFRELRGQENVFYDIQEQENAFLAYKNKKAGFGPELAIFPSSFS